MNHDQDFHLVDIGCLASIWACRKGETKMLELWGTSVAFNGTNRGLTAANLDPDAFDVLS